MILITDISDCLGQQVLSHCLQKKTEEKIRILVDKNLSVVPTDDPRVEMMFGSMLDHPYLDMSMKGVDQLLICNFNLLADYRAEYLNLINTAIGAEVKQVIFVSSININSPDNCVAIENRQTEEIIQKSGIPYTIFRVNLLMEHLPLMIGDPAETNVIYYPADKGRIGFVSVQDVAEIITAFLYGKANKNKVYTISHDTSYSMADIALKLSLIMKRPMSYESIDNNLYGEILLQLNLPKHLVRRLQAVALSISLNEYDYTNHNLEKLLQKEESTRELKSEIYTWFHRKSQVSMKLGYKVKTLFDYLKESY